MAENLVYTVQYRADGTAIAEQYQSALGAIGRVGALVSRGVGAGYAIYAGDQRLMDQAAIFESLKVVWHQAAS
jgi:hypothetical protein